MCAKAYETEAMERLFAVWDALRLGHDVEQDVVYALISFKQERYHGIEMLMKKMKD